MLKDIVLRRIKELRQQENEYSNQGNIELAYHSALVRTELEDIIKECE